MRDRVAIVVSDEDEPNGICYSLISIGGGNWSCIHLIVNTVIDGMGSRM